MARTVVISDDVLRLLVTEAQERITLHGTRVERASLATAQLALDTTLDTERLLGWSRARGVVQRFSERDRALGQAAEDTMGLLGAMLRQQCDALGCDLEDARSAVAAIGALLVAGEFSAMQQHHGHIDEPTHKAVAQTLNTVLLVLCRFAPAEVRG